MTVTHKCDGSEGCMCNPDLNDELKPVGRRWEVLACPTCDAIATLDEAAGDTLRCNGTPEQRHKIIGMEQVTVTDITALRWETD